MAAGGNVYDLIAPASDITKLIIDAGFVEPIDTSRIEQWDNIFPRFRELDNIQHDGEHYAMPYTWGALPFMYRNDAFETPPTSLAAMFDPANAGRISLWDDKSAIYVAARMNGDTNIYTLSDEQLAAAVDTLVEQKPLVRKYWSTAGELVDLYAGGEIDISNTWAGYQSALLAEEGIEVTEFIPDENAEGWMDSWMIVDGAGDNDCVYEFLNLQSSEARSVRGLERQRLLGRQPRRREELHDPGAVRRPEHGRPGLPRQPAALAAARRAPGGLHERLELGEVAITPTPHEELSARLRRRAGSIGPLRARRRANP